MTALKFDDGDYCADMTYMLCLSIKPRNALGGTVVNSRSLWNHLVTLDEPAGGDIS